MARTQIKELGEGSKLLKLIDDKFTTSLFSVSFINKLDSQKNAKRALLSYIMKNSCKQYPDVISLNKRSNYLYGAKISAIVSKHGDYQSITFPIIYINDRFVKDCSLSEECIKLLCSVISEPNVINGLFDKTEFETQKRCLIEEIKSEIADKRVYAINRCSKSVMQGEPSAMNKLGEIEEIESIKYEELLDTWKQLIGSSRVYAFFASDRDIDIEKIVKGRLELCSKGAVCPTEQSFNKTEQLKEIEESMAVNQAKLVMGFRTKQKPDSQKALALKLMSALLGGTTSSLLFKNVREKLSLCYYCSARSDGEKGVMLIDSGLEESNYQTAREEILKCLDTIKSGEFTDNELEETKRFLKNSYKSMNDSQISVMAWYLNRALQDDALSPEQELDIMENISREQIIEAANSLELNTVFLLKPNAQEPGGTN